MITTTSTTGYMSLAVLLLTGALQNKKLFPNHRKLRWLFVMGIICIIGEWMINGESSIMKAMCLVNLNQWKALIANHYRWMQ